MNPDLLVLPSAVSGERIVLRPYRRGDGKALFAAICEDREHLSAFLPWVDRHRKVEDSETYARQAEAWWNLREDFPMAIERVDGRLLGSVGIHRVDWSSKKAELGYWIRRSAVGSGYAREAVTLAVGILFQCLQLARAEIQVRVENLHSRKIPIALGFEETGIVTDDRGRVSSIFTLSRQRFIEKDWSRRALARLAEAGERD